MKIIKFVLLILLSLLATKMKYTNYEMLRLAVFAGSLYLAYENYKTKTNLFAILFLVVGLAFEPFIKFNIYVETWVLLDFIASIIIIASLLIQKD